MKRKHLTRPHSQCLLLERGWRALVPVVKGRMVGESVAVYVPPWEVRLNYGRWRRGGWWVSSNCVALHWAWHRVWFVGVRKRDVAFEQRVFRDPTPLEALHAHAWFWRRYTGTALHGRHPLQPKVRFCAALGAVWPHGRPFCASGARLNPRHYVGPRARPPSTPASTANRTLSTPL